MKEMDLLEAVGYVDQDLIIKTEAVQGIGKRNLRVRWAILIAAALLLCGTAAAGILWNKPEVLTGHNSQTLLMNQGYRDLPDGARSAILASLIPERDYKAFFSFDTVEDWQAFFGLPFVSSPLAAQNDANAQAEPDIGGRLVIEGPIETFVSTAEQDGEREPAMMWSNMSLTRYDENGDRWIGDLDIFAAFTEEAASGQASVIWESTVEESVTDYTTPSGIPCVISQSAYDGGDRVDLCLYYGFDSVLYRLRTAAHSDVETAEALQYLKEIADSLQISYPAGS